MRLTHPRRPSFGLFQLDQMIFRTETLTQAKVRAAPSSAILFEHAIDTSSLQLAQQEIGSVISIAQQNVACFQRVEH
ncbi:hypothetical protein D3C87_1616860 [compost metagenome]